MLEAALTGGDDYELVFTADADARPSVERAAELSNTAVTRIGRIVAEQSLSVLGPGGEPIRLDRPGWQHF